MLLRIALILAAFATASAVRAHDPYESWTSVLLRSESLELNITFAQSTALRLIDPEAKISGLTTENFATYRPRFEKEAAALFILTAGRKPLLPRTLTVEFTDENDVAFKVIYPRPAPGRLHFHAVFIRQLGAGYGGIVEAADMQGNQLGWEQLSSENPNFEIVIPESSSTKK
jgi:hypothetical protein